MNNEFASLLLIMNEFQNKKIRKEYWIVSQCFNKRRAFIKIKICYKIYEQSQLDTHVWTETVHLHRNVLNVISNKLHKYRLKLFRSAKLH